jgi:hypothetical protein
MQEPQRIVYSPLFTTTCLLSVATYLSPLLLILVGFVSPQAGEWIVDKWEVAYLLSMWSVLILTVMLWLRSFQSPSDKQMIAPRILLVACCLQAIAPFATSILSLISRVRPANCSVVIQLGLLLQGSDDELYPHLNVPLVIVHLIAQGLLFIVVLYSFLRFKEQKKIKVGWSSFHPSILVLIGWLGSCGGAYKIAFIAFSVISWVIMQ